MYEPSIYNKYMKGYSGRLSPCRRLVSPSWYPGRKSLILPLTTAVSLMKAHQQHYLTWFIISFADVHRWVAQSLAAIDCPHEPG
jgi:hypothetical protein